ncbi:flagellar motor protein MotB [Minwuia thermotolerans]|uniref:Motility protein MotB n=1 Tax=Minwuia thermotolerans TaxID=2056226 RepID=A0A2M9FZX7_9PROT|nr:flagellar motor protein MotB [Minwuia thermotolerans]PJK29005.1 motility protein MotB [Minwuia thermotolerans]
MADGNQQPIIVKKIVKGGHAHHGGAWKVAYADFVTAMMAFFLLLWLLNVTTDEQQRGIADYFAPAAVSQQQSGSGGAMGGQTMVRDGARISNAGLPTVVVSIGDIEDEEENHEDGKKFDPAGDEIDEEGISSNDEKVEDSERGKQGRPGEDDVAEELARREEEAFNEAMDAIEQAIEQAAPEMQELAQNLMVDMTPEGLRIQLVDSGGRSMFPKGSPALEGHAKQILMLVTDVMTRLPNKIKITGHTDATPYRSGNGYGNWELSADRANASRRALLELGVPQNRIDQVTGKAAQELLVAEDPYADANRRISIVLMRQAGLAAEQQPVDALKSIGLKVHGVEDSGR